MDLFQFKKKSMKIIFSIIASVLVMSTCFTSFHASAMSIYSGIDSFSFLSSLYSLLLSGKVVADNFNNPFPGSTIQSSDIDEYLEFFEKANEYQDGLGDELKSHVMSGALNGTMTLDEATRKTFLDYLEYCNGSVPIFKTTEQYPLISAGYTTTIIYNYHTTSNPAIQTDTITVKCNSPYFFGLREVLSTPSYSYRFLFISQDNSVPIISRTSTSYSPACSIGTDRITLTDSNGSSSSRNIADLRITYLYSGQPFYITDSISIVTEFWPGLNRFFSLTDFADMLYSITNTDYATLDSSATTSAISSTDDVISRSSTVASTGEIESDFVLSIPQYEKLVNVIDAVREGVLSLKDALASLSLSSVKNDATVQEKEQAISNLADTVPAQSIGSSAITDTLTVPSAATSTVNEATEQFSLVQHLTRSIANTIADIRGEPRPYPDEPDNVGPSGDPYLDGWNFPDLSDTDPDPGGTGEASSEDANRTSDVIAGIGFVTGFMTSFFNVSKGFNLTWTIGISFVIFSVIIGANHFFGALMSTGQDVKTDIQVARMKHEQYSDRHKHNNV